uniref:PIN domain-containing protein n=1 Tax=uncultured Thiotrichaceae bacterium TaxID=298394 RepID=A0A6S6SDG2_9GAMM|nr:MAG: Unknown protein [uncultured Thiotrichaceae bacterium]
MILDSNILIYASKVQNDLTGTAMTLIKQQNVCVSAISCLEVLGYHKLKNDEKTDLENMLERMTIFMVSDKVIEQAIALRQQQSMSLGDAIIAATALQQKQVLYTRNTSDFKWIDGLSLVNPFDA